MLRLSQLLVPMATLLFSVAGQVAQCATPNAASNKASSFAFRLPAEPETLDWNLAHTLVETHILVNLMDGLVALDPNLKVVPALAKSWKISTDGKTYTFSIRPGVKWSDGVQLKAQDFVNSWKRLLTPSTAASYSYCLFDIEGAEDFNRGVFKDFNQVGIRALDDLTLQVKLKQPVAHWLYMPTFWVTFPVRQDLIDQYGRSWAKPNRMATLGPFTLAAHETESKIVLKRNPNYYGGPTKIEQATGYIVSDDATALKLYESGKLDFLTDISTTELPRLAKNPELKSFPYLKTVYLGFALPQKSISSVHLRKAIAMGIDRSQLSEVLQGKQQPATTFVPSPIFGFEKSFGLTRNLEKAKAEFKLSGYDATKTGPIDLVIPNRERPLAVGQFLQGELKKNLGLDVTLQPFDHKSFLAQLKTKKNPLFLWSWSADYPDPDNFLSIFLGESGNNHFGWKDTAFDAAVIHARGLKDKTQRAKIYHDLQKKLIEEETILIPLYYEPILALVRARVHHLELNPLNYLNLRKVDLDP